MLMNDPLYFGCTIHSCKGYVYSLWSLLSHLSPKTMSLFPRPSFKLKRNREASDYKVLPRLNNRMRELKFPFLLQGPHMPNMNTMVTNAKYKSLLILQKMLANVEVFDGLDWLTERRTDKMTNFWISFNVPRFSKAWRQKCPSTRIVTIFGLLCYAHSRLFDIHRLPFLSYVRVLLISKIFCTVCYFILINRGIQDQCRPIITRNKLIKV